MSPPTPKPGLTASKAAAVYADNAEKKISTLLPDGATAFAPLAAAITRDYDAGTTTVSAPSIYVESIRSDGDNGFHVTIVQGEDKNTIHFTKADFDPDGNDYEYTDPEGSRYSLWSYSDGFSKNDRTTGSSNYDYFTILGGTANTERYRFVFGARTPMSALPKGSAGYEGGLYANSWDVNNPSSSQRQRLYGHMRIVANFDLGRLEGSIRSIRGTDPGADGNTRTLWPTSSFKITDGRINNGQFTATLEGHDSDPDPSLGRSAAGYVGGLLGEFYGPRADEMGAVLSAKRDAADDAHDRVLQGYVYSRRVLGKHTDTEPFSTGVDRDSNTSPRVVPQDANNRVTEISSDGAGGYRITYLIDGQPKTVELGAEDGPWRTSWQSYTRRDGAILYYLRPYDSEYSSVALWDDSRYANADSDSWVSGTWGYVVHGTRTPGASMPTTGSANYRGSAYAYVWEPENPSIDDAAHLRGSLNLSADFAAGSISGEIGSLERRMTSGSPYSSFSGRFHIGNGQIQGNTLSGLGFSGSVKGAFYGPAAEEAAGIMQATDADSKMLHGRFIGTR